MARVKTIPLGTGNSYLVIDRKAIFVDYGYPGHEQRLLRALAREGLAPQDVSMLYLTHGHVDHFGSLYALKQYIPAPIAICEPDLEYFLSGTQATLYPRNAFTRVMCRPGGKLKVKKRYQTVPEIVFTDEVDLTDYGVDGKLIPTPGHTLGSSALVLAEGPAFTGDTLLRRHFISGPALAPPIMRDYALNARSVQRLLDAGAQTFYPGHGRRFEREEIQLGVKF